VQKKRHFRAGLAAAGLALCNIRLHQQSSKCLKMAPLGRELWWQRKQADEKAVSMVTAWRAMQRMEKL